MRAYHYGAFDIEGLLAAKRGQRISVCLPARNEATTVGPIVATIRNQLTDGCGLVDETIVVDDGSTDGTAAAAEAAGATVVGVEAVLPEMGSGHGKGEAMWKGLAAATGD